MELVIVDRAGALVELLRSRLEEDLYTVTVVTDPGVAVRFARGAYQHPPSAVLIDLEISSPTCNGLDVMIAFDRWCPESPVIAYTDGGRRGAIMLQVAWQTIQPAAAVSKRSPLAVLLATVQTVVRTGEAEIDPVLRSLVEPAESLRPEGDRYLRLTRHLGHAKVWGALLAFPRTPSDRELAEHSGLAVNTVKHYRNQLARDLQLEGFSGPSVEELHDFAHVVRPFLAPVVEARLGSRRRGCGTGPIR